MAKGSPLEGVVPPVQLSLDLGPDVPARPVDPEPEPVDPDCPCLYNGQCAGNHNDVTALVARIQTLQQEAMGTDQIRKFIADLDRCPHGRHAGDTCAGWYGPGPRDGGCKGGISTGNPHMQPGAIIGYGLRADPIRVPERGVRHDARNWYDRSSRLDHAKRAERVKDTRPIIEEKS